jgi:16S rRNA C967 or C1407 C5-methylase (RsmB/RsmF family)/NOL1/NOP2/fmu family ribosome biogenesis protein
VKLPEGLIDSLKYISSFDAEAFAEVHAQHVFETSVRINPRKSTHHLPLKNNVPWSERGFTLAERPSFTLDPFFHAGHYYVQESSSMFLEEVIRQTVSLNEPIVAIDLCAAPGGKSTLMQSVLHPESLLICNEVIQSRVQILKENIIKWGSTNVVVLNQDPAAFSSLNGHADLLMIDAPCSGSGLFRRDPDLVGEWSKANVQLCSERQQRILADSWDVLKEGGTLVYSTCSYSEEENEKIIDWISREFETESCRIAIKEEWGIEEVLSQYNNYGYRFWPYKVHGEGFFIAAFRKKSSAKEAAFNKRGKIQSFTQKEKEVLCKWIRQVDGVDFIHQGEKIAVVPEKWKGLIASLVNQGRVRYAGVELGSFVRDELIPEHSLALSGLLHADIEKVQLSLEQSLDYLRRNEWSGPSLRKGWILVQYQDAILGWIKGVGNRVNNYYPKEWRIRMLGN